MCKTCIFFVVVVVFSSVRDEVKRQMRMDAKKTKKKRKKNEPASHKLYVSIGRFVAQKKNEKNFSLNTFTHTLKAND